MHHKQSTIDVNDLFYYFDAQEKNLLDYGRLGRKTGQVLALRSRLLSLPDGEFESAMGAIEKIVGPSSLERNGSNIPKPIRQARALELFEQVGRSASDKPNQPIQKI